MRYPLSKKVMASFDYKVVLKIHFAGYTLLNATNNLYSIFHRNMLTSRNKAR